VGLGEALSDTLSLTDHFCFQYEIIDCDDGSAADGDSGSTNKFRPQAAALALSAFGA